MAFRGDIETLVLAALADGPKHGYDITKALHARSSSVLKFGEGQLYPVLHRLEEAGLVVADWEVQEGRPNRKTYQLTPAGFGRLDEARQEWERFSAGISQVLRPQRQEFRHA